MINSITPSYLSEMSFIDCIVLDELNPDLLEISDMFCY